MKSSLNQKQMGAFLEFVDTNKQLFGLEKQRDGHEVSLKNIRDWIKRLKANRTMSFQQVISNNIIAKLENEDALKMLMDARKQTEIGLKSLDEQIMHRRDGLETSLIKVYHVIKEYIPPDMYEDVIDYYQKRIERNKEKKK